MAQPRPPPRLLPPLPLSDVEDPQYVPSPVVGARAAPALPPGPPVAQRSSVPLSTRPQKVPAPEAAETLTTSPPPPPRRPVPTLPTRAVAQSGVAEMDVELARMAGSSAAFGSSRSKEHLAEAAAGLWKGLERQHNAKAQGVALRSGHIANLRKRAAQARTRTQVVDSFWQMQELVHMASPQDLIELLQEERGRYADYKSDSDLTRWVSTRQLDGSLPQAACTLVAADGSTRVGGGTWSEQFGDARAGVNFVDDHFGWTIGMHAAAQGKLDVVQALLGWDPREGFLDHFAVNCCTTFRMDVGVRCKKTRPIAWAARKQRNEEGAEWQDPVLLQCYSIEDPIGSTLRDIARRRMLSVRCSKALIDGCKAVYTLVGAAVEETTSKLRAARTLAERDFQTGISPYFDEAEYRLQLSLGESCLFSHFAHGLIELYSLDEGRSRQASKLPKMVGTFEAWNMSDPSLLGLGSETMSHLLLHVFTVLDKAATPSASTSAAQQDDTIDAQIRMLQVLLRKLGPSGGDIFDFTVQNENGQTLMQLSKSLSTKTGRSYPEFSEIPPAIQASRPLYKKILPTTTERVYRMALLAKYGRALVMFYIDLGIDVLSARSYYESDKTNGTSFWMVSVSIMLIHLIMQILMDYATSVRGVMNKDWRRFGFHSLLNVLHVRILWETHRAVHLWRGLDGLPRSAPASYEQVKLVEGMFESLPQTLLKTLRLMLNLKQGFFSDRLLFDGASALMSYTSAASTLSMMGMRVHHEWRISFLLFTGTQLVIRSVCLSYLLAYHDHDPLRLAPYLAASMLATLYFDIILPRKGLSVLSFISLLITFMTPIDIPRFKVLRNAQPRAARLSFYAVRQAECLFVGALFALECLQMPAVTTCKSEKYSFEQETELTLSMCSDGQHAAGLARAIDAVVVDIAAGTGDGDVAGCAEEYSVVRNLVWVSLLWCSQLLYLLNVVLPYSKTEQYSAGLQRLRGRAVRS